MLSPDSASNKIIVFRIDEKLFGGELSKICEVLEKEMPLAWVPRAPAFVKGAVAHHGQAILLIDLNAFLHLPAQETETVILLDSPDRDIGLCVGKILGIVDMTGGDIKETDKNGDEDRGMYVDRFVQWKDRVVGLLNIERLVSDIDGYF